MIKASGGLAKQERLEEMVASRSDATGIDPRRGTACTAIKLAIDPPDSNPTVKTTSTAGAAVSRYQSRHAA
jgi:hypothetical protein